MLEFVTKIPQWLLLLTGYLVVAGLGYVDYLTGDYSMLIFYLFPISLVSWYLGLRAMFFLSLAAGGARLISDYYSYSAATFAYRDSFQDMLFLLVMGFLVAQMKKFFVND